GALEVLRGGHRLPGTPFPAAAIGAQQTPWRELLEHGTLPKPAPDGIPGPTPVSPPWRDMLETADADPHTEYHLGIAQWHADDRAQAVRSWERGLEKAPVPRWPLLRCLAVAAEESGRPDHAAELYAEAFADLGTPGEGDLAASEEGAALLVALARETVEAHLSAGRPGAARALLAGLPGAIRERGRFRLLLARTLVAEGDTGAAREIFDAGFEVADLREGAGILGELWASVSDEPLPDAYDFRMSPPEG
ncbi:tetratricopeptide repeat protein, partial [Streptomyces anulatus]|nr:tetratricopeptide repeat protein [Streptomyces anulatus]